MKTIKEYLESIKICEFKESVLSNNFNNYLEDVRCSKSAKLFIYNYVASECTLYLCEEHFHLMFRNDSYGGTYNKFNDRLNINVYIYLNSHTNSEFNVLTLEEFKKVNLLS